MADIQGPGTGPPTTTTTPLSASLTALLGQLLPTPGFSSIAIPIPRGSVYLNNPMLTEEPYPITKPVNAPTSPSLLPAPPKKAEPNGAFTLLIVNDNPIDRKILAKICERWGQPYEMAENGLEAVEMYKRDPVKFRCILMDLVMPVMNGFEATEQIRKFEKESWEAYSTHLSPPSSSSSATRKQSNGTPEKQPVRCAVIVALAPSYSVAGIHQRIAASGFDLSMCRPLYPNTICNMLFSGPGVNVVGLLGGVDDDQLRAAGYPLKVVRRKPSSIGEREMGEALGRGFT
ncbi:eukaryotic translation initiation factor 3 subunit E [Pestalotiopsis sp. IQ-011]